MPDYLKAIISGLIIFIVIKVSKSSSYLSSVLASLPLISLLAIVWLYFESKNVEKLSAWSIDVFWLVLPSLSFYLLFPWLLNLKANFYVAFSLSIVMMVICYLGVIVIQRAFK